MIRAYASHAIPQVIKAQLRTGRTVIINRGNDVKTISPKDKGQSEDTVTLISNKDGKSKQISLRNLADDIAVTTNGTFFSSETVNK